MQLLLVMISCMYVYVGMRVCVCVNEEGCLCVNWRMKQSEEFYELSVNCSTEILCNRTILLCIEANMYVCVYVCMHVCMYVCLNERNSDWWLEYAINWINEDCWQIFLFGMWNDFFVFFFFVFIFFCYLWRIKNNAYMEMTNDKHLFVLNTL